MNQNAVPGIGRVERKKEETKQKIIMVAMGLFKDQGVEATTMEQIAQDVDVAKGTLYNYFPAKEAIIDEYVKQRFRDLYPERILKLRQLPDTRSRLVQLLSELIEGVQAQKDIFEKYLVYRIKDMISLQVDESAESGLSLLSAEIIQLGQENGEIRDDLPLDILIDLFEFVMIEVAMQLYQDPERFDARTVIQQGVDLFLNGARPDQIVPC